LKRSGSNPNFFRTASKNRTLLERIREDKSVKRVLEILEEKLWKTKCERIKDVEKKWCEFRVGVQRCKSIRSW